MITAQADHRAAKLWGHLWLDAGLPLGPRPQARALILRAPTRKPGFNDAAVFWGPEGGPPLWLAVTCDPGPTTLKNPANPRGAAVLALGVYPEMWEAGEHPRSKPPGQRRPALVQVGPCTVDRVGPGVVVGEDSFAYPTAPDTGMFGINFHSMGTPDWSAGCVGPHTQAEVLLALALVGDARVDVVVAAASAWNMLDLLPEAPQ